MSDSFLSTIWYRVANLQPRLRPHVKVHRHRYRGQAWYVLHDQASGRVHRFTPAAYLFIGQLDGGQTVDEVWRGLAETHDSFSPGQDDVIQLLSRLHQNDLIQYRSSPDVADLLERYNKQSRQVIRQNLTNPMSIRLPLWDPDRFLRFTLPAVRWLTGWFGFCFWLVVCALGVVTATIHWSALTGDIGAQLLSTQNIAISLLTYPLLKALHELGHGYLTRARGGAVHEMGIMFLVFFPVPYVDASAASAFRSKWHRASVAAGGIFVETFVAAIAVMVWAGAEPGLVRAFAFNLVMIGGLSTLLVNGNPLLKFDGYYVFSDLLEIPNLATRATRYWGHVVQRRLFGARNLKPEPATGGEKLWFILYAPAAWVYRMIVMVGIAIFIAQHYFILGVGLAVWSVFNGLVKPMAKNIHHVLTAPALRKVRRRAVAWTFIPVAAVLVAILVVPLPLRTTTQGVVWLPDAAVLRAGTTGFISAVSVGQGTQVARGEQLAMLDHPTLAAKLQAIRARRIEARQRLAMAEASKRSEIEAARLALAQVEAELARETDRQTRLSVVAGLAGAFRPVMPVSDMPGRYVSEGDLIGHVLPPRAAIARVVVRQDDIAIVRQRFRGAEIRIAGDLAQVREAQLARSVPQATDTLPAAALGAAAGGPFLTDPSDRDGVRLLEQAFLFDLALPEAMQTAPFGSRVLVRFDLGDEPAAFQIWRRVRQLFLRQFDA